MTIPEILQVVGAVTVLLSFLTAMVKFLPVRWVVRRLITEPAEDKVRSIAGEVVHDANKEIIALIEEVRADNKREHAAVMKEVRELAHKIDRTIDTLDKEVGLEVEV